MLDNLPRFEADFVACCNHLVKVGLEERKKRLKEVEDYRATHKRASEANQQVCVERVKSFEELKAQVRLSAFLCTCVCHFYFCSYFSLLQLVPGVRGKSVLKELEAAIESLDHDLMRLEMQLVEQLDVSGQPSA